MNNSSNNTYPMAVWTWYDGKGGLAWLRRYQIGVYGDGEEYMIHEDRVVTDDKDYSVSRSTLLWFKMFV